MTRTVVIAIVTSAMLALTFFGGHRSGQTKERTQWQAKEINTLRQHAAERDRLTAIVAEKQKEYNDAQDEINRLAVRLSQSNRLRVQSEHRTKIEQATSANLRIYARGLHDLYSTCRKEFEAVGLEGARASSGVGALNVK